MMQAGLLAQKNHKCAACNTASFFAYPFRSAVSGRSAPRRPPSRKLRFLPVKAAAATGATPTPDASSSDSSSSSGGGSGSSTSSNGAVYIKDPLGASDVLEYPDSSVVVLGDVPPGAAVKAGGDVIILGTLYGEAAAGCSGDVSSMVLLGRLGSPATAVVSVAGRTPALLPTRENNVMLLLEGPGGGAAVYQAAPGSPPLPAAAGPESPLPKLARTAAALGVLGLGVALITSPGQVMGGLLSTNAESIAGAALDVFVFGWILLQGAGLLSDGSELLLEIVNPGIIGGVVLPVLGALPDSLIILTSLNASRAEAQEAVAVGIGTLAGSTVLLLSLAWGCSVLLGRCDLNPVTGEAIDKRLTRGWDLQHTGITVDNDVRSGAAIMALSVLLYGVVQVPAFMGFQSSPQAALTGAVMCLTAMVGYCVYSVLYPQLQQRRIDAARRRRFRMVAVKALAVRSNERYGSLVEPTGRLNPDTVRSIFDEFDEDKSGAIDTKEVQGLLLGLQLAGGRPGGSGLTVDKDTLDYWMKEFDTNTDSRISYDEFNAALSRWVQEKITITTQSMSDTELSGGGPLPGGFYSSMLDPGTRAATAVLADLPPDDLAALQETAAALEGETADEAEEDLAEPAAQPLSARDILMRALLKMGGGIALCAIFSDPLVEALTSLSRATGIPPFVCGFVLTPLASNSSEFVSSLNFAARKRRKNMSLTLSQVYGAVTMNNTLVLGLFLLVVYLQRLDWVYSSEVTVIVAATMAIGALGYSRSTFKALWALPALALYPLSLLGVYVLDTWLGWQ